MTIKPTLSWIHISMITWRYWMGYIKSEVVESNVSARPERLVASVSRDVLFLRHGRRISSQIQPFPIDLCEIFCCFTYLCIEKLAVRHIYYFSRGGQFDSAHWLLFQQLIYTFTFLYIVLVSIHPTNYYLTRYFRKGPTRYTALITNPSLMSFSAWD